MAWVWLAFKGHCLGFNEHFEGHSTTTLARIDYEGNWVEMSSSISLYCFVCETVIKRLDQGLWFKVDVRWRLSGFNFSEHIHRWFGLGQQCVYVFFFAQFWGSCVSLTGFTILSLVCPASVIYLYWLCFTMRKKFLSLI